MHVHVLQNSSERAFLPENDNPVKHSAVMSSWLPDCYATDFKLASFCQDRMCLEEGALRVLVENDSK